MRPHFRTKPPAIIISQFERSRMPGSRCKSSLSGDWHTFCTAFSKTKWFKSPDPIACFTFRAMLRNRHHCFGGRRALHTRDDVKCVEKVDDENDLQREHIFEVRDSERQ
ncbi:hypothetical protein PF005_g9628 [Phytophthora fragariae]|uniref:Uncharacterized protein n=1 Tax=Phytophthora fragariae TaxID=53985 RepID=A0A6A3YA12_9STRA|nr:hypothetical protein PF005_g9628 [Phytophthora fragariae]